MTSLFCFPFLFILSLGFLITFFFNHCRKKSLLPSVDKDQKMEEPMIDSEIPVLEEEEEEEDRLSSLPDSLIISILSVLPVDDAVRTGVLSKRWRSLWRYSTHLDIDQSRILKHALRRWFQFPKWSVTGVRSQKLKEAHRMLMLEIDDAATLIKWILGSHRGPLSSVRILHLAQSRRNGDAVEWIRYILEEKGVKELSMECEFIESWSQSFGSRIIPNTPIQIPLTLGLSFEILSQFCILELTSYILKSPSSFPSSHNLKTLTLRKVWLSEELLDGILSNCLSLEYLTLARCKQIKLIRIHSGTIKFLELKEMTMLKIEVFALKLLGLELDTIVCRWKGLVIYAPNLQVLRAFYCDPKSRGMPKLRFGRVLLTTKAILYHNDLPSCAGSIRSNIFGNLVTLCIDLDLNGARETIALASILGSCFCLQNLEIINQVFTYFKTEKTSGESSSSSQRVTEDFDSSQNCPQNVQLIMFWETRELCVCVTQELKRVYIRGFKGKELELEFVKYLITSARMLKRITICFDDDCSWDGATSTVCLFSLVSASPNLSITLKPGKEYLANGGASFQNWISDL